MNKILIAMSGGVDSSVTAYLLQKEGYKCSGCIMHLYKSYSASAIEAGANNNIDTSSDINDARKVANRLNIDFTVLDYEEEFKNTIINDFIRCYECGITPNPCVECNKIMKFGKLLEHAKSIGCDGISTGHYAQIVFEDGIYKLKKAVDLSKDQSYVLYNLNQDLLSRIKFPLGSLSKEEARSIAEEQGFVNAHKSDSQDICFVPDGDYAGMIERYTNKSFEPGDFVDKSGNVLGKHKGIIHYTIGQRKGLGISSDGRLYVIKIDVPHNTVVLGENEDLFNTTVHIKNFNWIAGNDIPSTFKCKAKIRYRMTEQPATVTYEGNSCATIEFDEPQRAATSGQSAVLYDGDVVLGGGIIS